MGREAEHESRRLGERERTGSWWIRVLRSLSESALYVSRVSAVGGQADPSLSTVDPYLGASAAPSPAPATIYPPPIAAQRSPSGSPYFHHSPSSGSLTHSSSANFFQPSASVSSFERLPSPSPRQPTPNERPMSHYSYGQGIERGGSPMYQSQGIERVGSPYDGSGRVHSPRRGM